MGKWTRQLIASVCDYELVKATLTDRDITKACEEVKRYQAAALCVQPVYIPTAIEQLQGSGVKVSGFISYPFGGSAIETKVEEARYVESLHADEIDVVLAIGAIREFDFDYVEEEIKSIVEAVSIPVKVIVECNLIDEEMKMKLCEVFKKTNASFISTNTGMPTSSATISDVSLLRYQLGEKANVKASGGILTAADVTAMLEAGANRVGVERFSEIMREADEILSFE